MAEVTAEHAIIELTGERNPDTGLRPVAIYDKDDPLKRNGRIIIAEGQKFDSASELGKRYAEATAKPKK